MKYNENFNLLITSAPTLIPRPTLVFVAPTKKRCKTQLSFTYWSLSCHGYHFVFNCSTCQSAFVVAISLLSVFLSIILHLFQFCCKDTPYFSVLYIFNQTTTHMLIHLFNLIHSCFCNRSTLMPLNQILLIQ